jgi:hypothetical protein
MNNDGEVYLNGGAIRVFAGGREATMKLAELIASAPSFT